MIKRTIEYEEDSRSLWYITYDSDDGAVKVGRSQYTDTISVRVGDLDLFVQHLYEVAALKESLHD